MSGNVSSYNSPYTTQPSLLQRIRPPPQPRLPQALSCPSLIFAYANPPIIESMFQLLLYLNLRIVSRQNLPNQIRPLNQAYALAVDIILITNLVHFFCVANSVYVKMIKDVNISIMPAPDVHGELKKIIIFVLTVKSLV